MAPWRGVAGVSTCGWQFGAERAEAALAAERRRCELLEAELEELRTKCEASEVAAAAVAAPSAGGYDGVRWQYRGDFDDWHDFGAEAIETTHHAWLDLKTKPRARWKVPVTSGGDERIVDLRKMTQTNPRTGKCRRVRLVVDIPLGWTTPTDTLLLRPRVSDMCVEEADVDVRTAIESLLSQNGYG